MNLIIVLAAVCVTASERLADFKVQAVSFTGHMGGSDSERSDKQPEQTNQDGVSDSQIELNCECTSQLNNHSFQSAADGIHDPRSSLLGLLQMWNTNEMQQINKLVSGKR